MGRTVTSNPNSKDDDPHNDGQGGRGYTIDDVPMTVRPKSDYEPSSDKEERN